MSTLQSLHAAFPILLCCLGISAPALADGGYFWHQSEKIQVGEASAHGQQAILVHFDDALTMVLQTGYEGRLAEFSWLIPIPSPVTEGDIHEADKEVYAWLDQHTAPSFYITEHTTSRNPRPSCGCSDAALGGDGSEDDQGQNTTEVLDTITTENYEIVVLDAETAEDLAEWLHLNQYANPEGSEGIFHEYLSRGWFFLAVRIRPSLGGEEVSLTTPPLQIDLTHPIPVYPLKISSLSSSPVSPITLYVIAAHRQRVENVATITADDFAPGCNYDSGDYGAAYEACLQDLVEGEGGRLYVTEWAGSLGGGEVSTINGYLGSSAIDPQETTIYLTRLHSYYMPDRFTDDLRLESCGNESYQARIQVDEIHLTQKLPEAARVGWAGLAVCVLALFWRRFPR